ncbi:diguanylate cyclase [Pseudoduganella sp. SL102]|uniref:GGDEF domain-containing protein n=1 Tax=Pseudoduganella sp. SL102 TaxID=2995154 RepID=UPI00248BFA1B|nr:GGDEF domain-containing protein [Pseudoduganella sp. SL102]WBS05182.1 diguanylate cyclase [Pseudoduganella sp. SL102]
MPSIARVLIPVMFAASLSGALVARAEGGNAEQAKLKTVHALAERSTTEALTLLQSLQAALRDDAPYALRQQLLRTEVDLRTDAGQMDEAYAAERKSLALAIAHNDRPATVRARLGEVRQLLDKNRLDAAQAAMDRILAGLPADLPVTVKAAVESVQGDIANNKGKFDAALAAFLRALQLLQGVPDAGAQRAALLGRIAQIHINTDNPRKAVETTRLGLAESGLSAAAAGPLEYTEGMALIRLDRGAEGIDALQRALAAARGAGLVRLEATVRGNIADYYLRQHDYARAEREARLAMAASGKANDANLAMMASANLGFALMGQGRMAEGATYTDAVIAEMRQAGIDADLEAMLDEKGRALERAGLYKSALAVVREQQQVQQGTARIARDQAIARLQEEFDASRRSQKIALLERENHLKDAELGSRRMAQLATTFAAVLTVLAGTAIFLLYRRTARNNAHLQQLNAQLEFHSTRDALTGLLNRRSFLDRMQARAGHGEDDRRAGPEQGVDCFVLLDIDHFKSINDTWGHGVGDAVLVDVARRLASAVRDTDMVLRWGGEEFLVFAPAIDPARIAGMVKRVLEAIGSAPVAAGASTVPVSVTAGVVALPFAGAADSRADWQAAIRIADWALYQGKAQGRNQARIVTHLAAPVATVLTALDGTAGAAPVDGMIGMERVDGP